MRTDQCYERSLDTDKSRHHRKGFAKVAGVLSSFLGKHLLNFEFARRKKMSGSLDGRFHEAVSLRRRESLVSPVALGEFQHGKGLTVDHFRRREDLP